MPRSNFESLEKKFFEHAEFVGRNIAGAARCFAAINPFYPWDYQHPATVRLDGFAPVSIMVRHTAISGVLALCRIWDRPRNARKIDYVVHNLRNPLLMDTFEKSYEERREFQEFFGSYGSNGAGEGENCLSGFAVAAEDIESRFDLIKKSSPLGVLIEIRNKCLAHSEAIDLQVESSEVLEVFRNSLSLIERINLVIGLDGITHEIYEMYVEDARAHWADVFLSDGR